MFFLRKLIGRLLFVTVLGYVIRKLRESKNPRAQKVGHTANKVMGGAFGVTANGHAPTRRRGVARSAGSAAFGGLMSYFFDPDRGPERRERAKTFAKERVARSRPQPLLPERATPVPAGAVQTRRDIV